ncbi:lysosomal dipeptide transporter MFSD1-like [Argopecten irradians]|uniref:lysosomal dipeptide transporter MFSD1-like n=1 Tax=Argopecten irradians TaxID=31199 RepID=UPI0037195863
MRPNEWKWRYAILFCDCTFVFGAYYYVDLPSSLQVDFVSGEAMSCNANYSMLTSACCDTCLGLGPERYSLLYAFLFWTSAILSLLSGWVVDRIGNRVSAIAFIILTSVGCNLFALAVTPPFRNTSVMFPLMVTGRMLLGFTNGPLRIVQDRLVSYWFGGDSFVAISFITLTRRGGTFLNFLITANLSVHFSFTWAIWFGATLCSSGIIIASVMVLLDVHGVKKLDAESQQPSRRAINITEITNIPKTFWIHVAMISFETSAFTSFVAYGPEYIQLRYGYTKVLASYVIGATYIGPVFLGPFVALTLKKIDCNGLVATGITILCVPAYLLLAYCLTIPPVVITLLLGIIYSFDVIIMWKVTIDMIPQAVFGTAAGVAIFVSRLLLGITNFVVGAIVENTRQYNHQKDIAAYQNALLCLTALSVFSVSCGIFLNVLDIRNGDGVNKRFAKNTDTDVTDTTELIANDKLNKEYKCIASNGT